MALSSLHYPSLHDTGFSNILLLIPEQEPNTQAFQDIVDLAVWKRLYQAKLPTGEKVADFELGNSPRKAGSNKRSLKLWA
jgi:hypothetical protein